MAEGEQPRVAFTLDDAQRAADEWGANCGPGALAAVTGRTLDEVRPHLIGFDQKRYTNPTMMFGALRSLGVDWAQLKAVTTDRCGATRVPVWPRLGLVRIQWEGPWTAAGVPMRARYRHTHWVEARTTGGTLRLSTVREPSLEPMVDIFDINAICVGGWVPLAEWSEQLVPWLLREVVPRANGRWHQTHVLELQTTTNGGTP